MTHAGNSCFGMARQGPVRAFAQAKPAGRQQQRPSPPWAGASASSGPRRHGPAQSRAKTPCARQPPLSRNPQDLASREVRGAGPRQAWPLELEPGLRVPGLQHKVPGDLG